MNQMKDRCTLVPNSLTCLLIISIALFSSNLYSQVESVTIPSVAGTKKAKHNKPLAAQPATFNDDVVSIYFYEDFSNGLEGSTEFGSFTTSGEHGELWFTTFPEGSGNGYDPSLALEGVSEQYGDQIPNFFGSATTIDSDSEENGFVMIDMDRFNSTTVEGEEPSNSNFTTIPINGYLVSPEIDLTGAENGALLSFHQSLRFCCNNYMAEVQVSVNGGSTWTGYDVFFGNGNEYIEEFIEIDFSEQLTNEVDLSSIYFRFALESPSISHYYWMIDDIRINAKPENELSANQSWYNNFIEFSPFETNDPSFEDFYDGLEYEEMPKHCVHPLNLGQEIENNGSEDQHNVYLEASILFPNGQVETHTSDIISEIPSGETIRIWINDVDISDSPNFTIGEYQIDYVIVQDEEDSFPETNIGDTKSFLITGDDPNTPIIEPSTMRNDRPADGSFYSQINNGVIWGVPYKFAEPQGGSIQITHIETVFASFESGPETVVNSDVLFNVRIGSVFDADVENEVVFDLTDPEIAESLQYIIQEEDVWMWESTDPEPYLWVSFELPEPIIVDPGLIYQAEVQIPGGVNEVYLPIGGGSERPSATLYEDGMWYHLGENSIPIRFRTESTCPDNVLIESTTCESFNFLGEEYTESGVYEVLNVDTAGCRIDYILDITILDGQNSSSEVFLESCDSLVYNGESFYASGQYEQVIPNMAGCDSTITINFTLLESTSSFIELVGCGSVEFQDQVYTESQTTLVTLVNSKGCDSLVYLSLTVFDAPEDTFIEEEVCGSFTFDEVTYTETGIYLLSYANENGCDSTIVLDLIIHGPENPICASLTGNIQLYANCSDIELKAMLYEPGTNVFVQEVFTTIDEYGDFILEGITPGAYDIYLKPKNYLQKRYNNYILLGGVQQIITGIYVGGDVNDDNKINVVDASCFNVCFGSILGDPNYQGSADLNCDSYINLVDASLMNFGFGISGIEPSEYDSNE